MISGLTFSNKASNVIASTQALPSDIVEGDLIVLYLHEANSGVPGPVTTPVGFTAVNITIEAGAYSSGVFYKIATPYDANSNLTNYGGTERYYVAVYRATQRNITSVSFAGVTSASTSGDIAAQTITSSNAGALFNSSVLAFAAFRNGSAYTSVSFSPSQSEFVDDGVKEGIYLKLYNPGTTPVNHTFDMGDGGNYNIAIVGYLTINFDVGYRNVSPSWTADVQYSHFGNLPTADNSSIDATLVEWNGLKNLIARSVDGGSAFSSTVVSTYSLVYTQGTGYIGGTLAPNGDIHFIPYYAPVGQKISAAGVVSTYSLVYTTSAAYHGGVLAPNGDIHFIPYFASVGQKISAAGVVSTYSLVYTTNGAYLGGVLAPNGDIHFVPASATRGQKITSAGVVTTYTLLISGVYYAGGVLAPNGDIHFVPYSATRGQKITSAGVVTTYSLAYTSAGFTYCGGVLAPNGDIHFVPSGAPVGQKISAAGVVSTYSLVYTTYPYYGGVLDPNGDIHFVPANASVGQKISAAGVVSTYSLLVTNSSGAYEGGVLLPSGDIHFIPHYGGVGQVITTGSSVPFEIGTCCSPFFNKF